MTGSQLCAQEGRDPRSVHMRILENFLKSFTPLPPRRSAGICKLVRGSSSGTEGANAEA